MLLTNIVETFLTSELYDNNNNKEYLLAHRFQLSKVHTLNTGCPQTHFMSIWQADVIEEYEDDIIMGVEEYTEINVRRCSNVFQCFSA